MRIKDDINFLQNPDWVVSKKTTLNQLTINNDFGLYQIVTTSPLGLPVRLDKTILFFLKHKLFKNNLESAQVETTRYQIAKNIFSNNGSFSQAKYQRIMISLEKWKSVRLFFAGSFYEKDEYVDKQFSIIDDFQIDAQKKLSIKFNESYVRQIKDTGCYKILNFKEYKNLIMPVALRLYEILLKNLTENAVFYIDARLLAEKLTIKKKTYESQIVAAIEPAIAEINSCTSLSVQFQFQKTLSLCVFKKNA